jgi:hypothetical protein
VVAERILGHISTAKRNLQIMSLGTALLLATTLILRSGDRLPVDGAVKQANGKVTFRSAGTLYSLPAEEVARIEEDTPAPEAPKETAKPAQAAPVARLRVSEDEKKRLIDALEKNHSGKTPAPPSAVPDQPKDAPAAEKKVDEEELRAQSRAYEDAVTAAKENLAALEQEEEAIERKIMSLIAMGYGPESFTYDSLQLERIRAAIPHARDGIARAEKAWADFRANNRRW